MQTTGCGAPRFGRALKLKEKNSLRTHIERTFGPDVAANHYDPQMSAVYGGVFTRADHQADRARFAKQMGKAGITKADTFIWYRANMPSVAKKFHARLQEEYRGNPFVRTARNKTSVIVWNRAHAAD